MESHQGRLFEYFKHVWIIKKKILFLGLITSFVGLVIWSHRSPVVYRPRVKLFVHITETDRNESTARNFSELDRMMFIANQQELIISFPLFERVQKAYAESTGKPVVENRSAAANAAEEQDLIHEIKTKIEILLFGKNYVDGKNNWGDPLYMAFRANVFFEPSPATGTFTVGYLDSDPKKALEITKYLAQGLIDLNHEIANKKRQATIKALQNEMNRAGEKVDEVKKEIQTFLTVNSFPEDSQLQQTQYARYLQLTASLNQSIADIESETAKLEETTKLQNKLRKQDDDREVANTVGVDKLVQDIQNEELILGSAAPDTDKATAKVRLEGLRKQLDRQISKRQSQLGEENSELLAETEKTGFELKTKIAAKIRELKVAKENKRKFENEIKKFPELQSKLSDLLFEKKQRMTLLEGLSETYLRTQSQDSELTQIFTIEEPLITDAASDKGKKLLYGLIGIIGLNLFGLGAYHYVRRTLFSKHDLFSNDLPKTTFLGAIPYKRKLRLGGIVEEFRKNELILRASQLLKINLFRSPGGGARVLTFSSTSVAAGKSMSTLCVAMGLKDVDLSVLVLDCDYRADSGNLTEYVGTTEKSRPFLPLRSKEELAAFVKTTTVKERKGLIPMLRMISTADQEEAYSYLLNDFKKDLDVLKGQFDVIILDAPPIFFADNLIFSSLSDGVVFCCPEGELTLDVFGEGLRTAAAHGGDSTQLFTLITKSRLAINQETAAIEYQYRYSRNRGRIAS